MIYNRTKKEATEKLIEMGAIWAESPKDVAMKSDIVVSIVGECFHFSKSFVT